MTSGLRKTLVVLATLFAIGAPASQALMGWGISAAAFSESGNETLRAAGYAFSIWGLIYTGLVLHAALQVFSGGRHEPLFAALSPAIIAVAGCGAWIIASGLDARWLSVVIILVSAASAWFALHRARGLADDPIARIIGVWPIALLGGWLLAASALNILTVLTAEGLIGEAARTPSALAGLAVVAALALAILRSGVSPVYALPVAWGLAAVHVAERADQPPVAWAAAAGALIVLVAAGLAARSRAGQAAALTDAGKA